MTRPTIELELGLIYEVSQQLPLPERVRFLGLLLSCVFPETVAKASGYARAPAAPEAKLQELADFVWDLIESKVPSFYERYLSSPEWQQKRAEIMQRAAGLCERCGRETARVVHHIHYRNLGNEDPGDLLALCQPCHSAEHRRA